MAQRELTGFADRTVVAHEFGERHEPTVLILPHDAAHRVAWMPTVESLVEAGRHVIFIEPKGRDSGLAQAVGDLNAVLRQLSARPAIIAAGTGAWTAAAALMEGEPDLATGLVLVDRPASNAAALPDATQPEQLKIPALLIGADTRSPLAQMASRIAGIEALAPDDGLDWQGDEQDAFSAILIEFLERQVPRRPPEYVAGSDPRTLRDALGTFASGVTVVTGRGTGGEPVGLTANSFTSVSLDPPLLLVCPARNASTLPILQATDHFAVNVLHIGQQATSNLFASRGADRFARTDYEVWDHDVPIIRNSLASFECRKYAEYDGGDHVILVGEVLRVRFAPQRDPLLYFRGKYRRLHFA